MPRSFPVASCLLAAAAAALLVGPADAFFFSRMPARLQQVQTQGPASRLALFGYVHARERKGVTGRGRVEEGGRVAASSTLIHPFARTHAPQKQVEPARRGVQQGQEPARAAQGRHAQCRRGPVVHPEE